MLRRPDLRSQRGQTAAEWLGVILLVAAIVAAVAATPLGKTVADGLQAAICRITGGQCDVKKGNYETGVPPLNECVRDSSKRGLQGSVKILRFELGGGVEGTKEIRADGSVRVTLKGNVKAGVDFSTPGGEFEGGGTEGGSGGGVEVNANAAASYGWDFKNEDEANDFIDKVEKKAIAIADPTPNMPFTDDDADIDLGEPTLKTYEGGVEVSGEGSAGSAELNGSLGAGVGVTFNEGNGDKTVFFKVNGKAGASAGPLGGDFAGEARLAVTYDKDGKEKSVRFIGQADLTTGFSLSPETLKDGDLEDVVDDVKKGGPSAKLGEDAGARGIIDANLDLTKPENLAAWNQFKAGLDPTNTDTSVIDGGAALLDRFNKDAVVNAKVYALSKTETGGGFDAVVFGAEGSYTTEDSKILGAWYRDKVNGGIKPWEACVQGLSQ